MVKLEIQERMEKVFKLIFPKENTFTEESSPQNIKGWDSLRHIMLISEVEKEFNVKFELEDMLSMRSFSEIRSAVLNNRKE